MDRIGVVTARFLASSAGVGPNLLVILVLAVALFLLLEKRKRRNSSGPQTWQRPSSGPRRNNPTPDSGGDPDEEIIEWGLSTGELFPDDPVTDK